MGSVATPLSQLRQWRCEGQRRGDQLSGACMICALDSCCREVGGVPFQMEGGCLTSAGALTERPRQSGLSFAPRPHPLPSCSHFKLPNPARDPSSRWGRWPSSLLFAAETSGVSNDIKQQVRSIVLPLECSVLRVFKLSIMTFAYTLRGNSSPGPFRKGCWVLDLGIENILLCRRHCTHWLMLFGKGTRVQVAVPVSG